VRADDTDSYNGARREVGGSISVYPLKQAPKKSRLLLAGAGAFGARSHLRRLSPCPLNAVRQMSGVAMELAEVDLVERFHA
jgi:hypothetical protein